MTARAPKDFPAIMSGPMVRALLDGRKTQTRRLLYSERRAKNPAIIPSSATILSGEYRGRRIQYRPVENVTDFDIKTYHVLTPWHAVRSGDRLWIRENWRADDYAPTDPDRTIYQADAPADALRETRGIIKWRASIHLPRNRSRIILTITRSRIERLQDISEADALAEGIESTEFYREWHPPSVCFGMLWRSLHGAGSWMQNPWVVAMTFTVERREIEAPAAAA